MGTFDRQLASAKRLIAKFGQPAQWQQNGFVADVNQPWEAVGTPQLFPVQMAFLPYQRIGHDFAAYLTKTEVPTGTIVGYMAGGLSFVPALADTVIRSDPELSATPVTYLIDDIDRVAPNGQTVLWIVYFKR